MTPRRAPRSTNPLLRVLAVLPLPFLLVFLGLAAGALSITEDGLRTATPEPLQLGKALVLVACLAAGLPGVWSERSWWRTLGHAVAALATSSGTAHGIVWALIGHNGGLAGADPRAPTWLVGTLLAGGILSAIGFAAVVVLVVRDLRSR